MYNAYALISFHGAVNPSAPTTRNNLKLTQQSVVITAYANVPTDNSTNNSTESHLRKSALRMQVEIQQNQAQASVQNPNQSTSQNNFGGNRGDLPSNIKRKPNAGWEAQLIYLSPGWA